MRFFSKNTSTITAVLFALIGLSSCKTSKQQKTTDTQVIIDSLQELVVSGKPAEYRGSVKRSFDLINTRLEVNFDWEKAQMNGVALLELKPYFYASDSLVLDAKGMDLKEVALVGASGRQALKYKYDSLQIHIKLDKTYKRSETFTVYIKYVAKPEELEKGGSEAITADKGLYFINRFGTEPNKPKQLWTQGETEASSCWFPTIDKPNERMTQEILITVDTSYVTLSNGILIYSTENPNGTRTDCWKQTLPAAPYLSMMAVGKWKVVKDKWRELEVNYYMEPEYLPSTKRIFGKTPAMLEFYSKRLGVDYPWEKFSQVIVRDYVSGAMENTTAVIHGDFFNQTEREMLDGDNETTVAHELFHQWFGDLVTCESWSNLPLNESFATYGEYLWLEHDAGREEADYHGQLDLKKYMAESAQKKEDLIRFYYDDKEDMFDMHSYAKGGRILHMLRKYLGDEAFFEGLKTYLTENKFQSVEIHNLRLAMEKVSGEDLNWFFNQWFLAKGHPVVEFQSKYDSLAQALDVTVLQKQNIQENALYTLPLDIDIYYANSKERKRVWVRDLKEVFRLKVKEKPVLVNIDAEKQLLCVKTERKTKQEWISQYNRCPLLMDRIEAINQLGGLTEEMDAKETVLKALKDKHFAVRALALRNTKPKMFENQEDFRKILLGLAKSDPKSSVRDAAIGKLGEYFKGQETMEALKEIALKDQSYLVEGGALSAIREINENEGLEMARKLAPSAKGSLLLDVALILADKGDKNDLSFFQKGYKSITENNSKYALITLIGRYAGNQEPAIVKEMMPMLKGIAMNETAWFIRLAGIQAISEVGIKTQSRMDEINSIAAKGMGNPGDAALMESLKQQQKQVEDLLAEIRAKESDPKVRRLIGAN
jgi:aminopeptidase N